MEAVVLAEDEGIAVAVVAMVKEPVLEGRSPCQTRKKAGLVVS